MPNTFHLPSPIVKVDCFEEQNITIWMKREDLIHPEISGNKYRKLKYNLLTTNDLHSTKIITKGGVFSNHIHAISALGNFYKKNIIGIIRGENVENKTLDFAKKNGMELVFVSRSDYRLIDENNFQDFLPQKINNAIFIPEGGTNQLALKGVAEMIDEIRAQLPTLPDYICSACGTGGTLAGIIAGLQNEQKVLGFSALKGDFLTPEVEMLLKGFSEKKYDNWAINTEYHFGGYAKMKPELLDFIDFFKEKYDILLDPVYTSKMMFGIFDLVKKGFFEKGTDILAVHTGGLQGWNGFRPNI
jgi:1-aminocyclopropane-1-carboxylate deaminase